MISVKCPSCGLVDWNVGDCKRCGAPLVGQSAEAGEFGYYRQPPPEDFAYGDPFAPPPRASRAGRAVLAVAAVAVLALVAVGVLYLANKPTKKQWFWSFYRSEPTVAEIFAHNLEVSGGAERFSKLSSFRAEGRMVLSGAETAGTAASSGERVTFVMHAKEPDKVEAEVRVGPPERSSFEAGRRAYMNFGQPAQPQVNVTVRHGFDGRKGWEHIERTVLTPGSTIPVKQYTSRELEGEELEKVKHYSPTTNLVRLAGEYRSLKLTGREPFDTGAAGGDEAYVVSGVNREGGDETFYFDTLTGLLLRVDFETEGAEGERVRVECVLRDYKEVGGLRLPHSLLFRQGGELTTMIFDRYFPNDPIPDSTFEMPD
jgi:hypothetical protein